jgi:phosphoesterase RecJ-like protein
MTEVHPSLREAGILAALEALSGVSRVVLTTHLNADGDGAGSQAAFAAFLASRGIQSRIVNPTPFPELFQFLLPRPEDQVWGAAGVTPPDGAEGPWVLEAGTAQAAIWCREADLVVVLDTGEVPRIGRVKPMVDHLPHLIIDHHPEGDQPLPGASFRDASASATGEMLFDLVTHAGGPWTRPIVEGLYTAILTDTGSFRFSNATPAVHRITAELIRRGASPDTLHGRIYGNIPMRRHRLLARALTTLEQSPDGRVAWMTIPADAWDALGCDPSDMDGMIDYPRTLAGVEVALLFRVVRDGVKVSFRANGEVDVNALARLFGGGGHVRASGALVTGPLDEVRGAVIRAALETAP